MAKPKSVEEYLAKAPAPWRESLQQIRAVLQSTDLEESIKWNFPCYSLGTKNLIGIGMTKNYCGVWFFQGALLSDPAQRLVNAQEGKTVAMRQLRFATPEEVDPDLVRGYATEAIEHQRAGREIKPQSDGEVGMPPELAAALAADPDLGAAFAEFTAYKQREFAEYISTAKRAATKKNRLKKILPMIRAGIGLSDKYRL